jgi:hypothetical protein
MMAQRKDQMRVIRQDAGFSAKLGFGASAAASAEVDRPGVMQLPAINGRSQATPDRLRVEIAAPQITPQRDDVGQHARLREESRKEEGGLPTSAELAMHPAVPDPSAAARGQVVYVAVSLTARQARLAEAWASAARCSVQFLIRRVAQGLRDEVFDDWERDGMPEVKEPRGARGKHPTSVTLTLRPQFAADLARIHDPLGLMGLARAMGPAYRARFQEAFDRALDKAPLHMTTEGHGK